MSTNLENFSNSLLGPQNLSRTRISYPASGSTLRTAMEGDGPSPTSSSSSRNSSGYSKLNSRTRRLQDGSWSSYILRSVTTYGRTKLKSWWKYVTTWVLEMEVPYLFEYGTWKKYLRFHRENTTSGTNSEDQNAQSKPR